MSSVRALILLVSACGFHGPATEVPGDGDAGAIDAPTALDAAAIDGMLPGFDAPAIIDGPTGADAQAAFACNGTDPMQMLCLAFENNTTDGSIGNSHVDVNGNGLMFPAGEDGLAVSLDVSDSLSISATDANHVTTQTNSLTIKAYVAPTSLPAPGVRMGIVDNDGYRMFIMPGGSVRCAIGNGATGGFADLTTTGGGISINAWTRVTCIYNGATISIYFDGALKNQSSKIGTIPLVTTSTQIGGNQGGGGGDNFIGLLDDLQLFRTSLIAP